MHACSRFAVQGRKRVINFKSETIRLSHHVRDKIFRPPTIFFFPAYKSNVLRCRTVDLGYDTILCGIILHRSTMNRLYISEIHVGTYIL